MKFPEQLNRLPLGLKVIIGALVVFIIIAILSPAHAQQCAPEDQVIATLENKFHEQPISRGIAANGALIVTWANRETGTWTITVHNGAGLACMVASVESFEAVAQKPNV